MRSGKKLTLGILPTFLCLVSMLVVACGGGSGGSGGTGTTGAQKAADSKQVFVSGYAEERVADIKTFDPALSTDANSLNAIDMVFTGLVQLDANLNVKGELAQSYSVGADGVTWTFKLKPNLAFSDGTPLTSTDVAYSIDRALQPATKSTTAGAYLNLIKDATKLLGGKIKTVIGDSIMTPDPSTVVIVTNKKASYFLDALTYSTSYVIEKKLIDTYGSKFADHLSTTSGGGAGPWMVKTYARGQEIDFVPNPHYYGNKPQLKEVQYPFYKDVNTAYKAYQTGAIEDAGVPSPQLASAKQLTTEYHNVPQLYINYYSMNYLVKPFDNIKVRQAFALAVNKDEIAHNIYKDTVIATNHIVPKGMPGYTANLTNPGGTTSTSGDLTKAKSLLSQGLQEEGTTIAALPPITIYSSSAGSADVRNEFAAEQQMWQALGVTIKFRDEDFNQLLSDITAATNNPKGIAMWGIAWIADYPDAQDWTTLQFDNNSPNNNMNYGQNSGATSAAQQQVQKQLEAADINPDSAARVQQYNTAEQQLVNDVAWLPIDQVAIQVVLKPCVVGYGYNAQGLFNPESWANVYISTDSNCGNATFK